MVKKTKSDIRKSRCIGFYILGIILILGMKYFYSKAGSNELNWILAPTAWWVGILKGVKFEYVRDVGYINHNIRFIIAPSCSGVQFMTISAATLLFTFIHRMKTAGKGMYWVGISLCSSYLYTIFVNGIRIVLSIIIPEIILSREIMGGWLSGERLHTIIGIAVYSTALFVLYGMGDYISGKISEERRICSSHNNEKSYIRTAWKYRAPVFWYFFLTLGIPMLRGVYRDNYTQFIEYAVLMTIVCAVILGVFSIVSAIRKSGLS